MEPNKLRAFEDGYLAAKRGRWPRSLDYPVEEQRWYQEGYAAWFALRGHDQGFVCGGSGR